MNKKKLDKKDKRDIGIFILVVIFILSLIIVETVNRKKWNKFSVQFDLYGNAVRVDRNFVVGIDQIIRGEEALKILPTITKSMPKLEEGMEVLILKMNIKNQSKKLLPPWNLRYMLYYRGYENYPIFVDPIKLELKEDPIAKEFKRLSFGLNYEPEEEKQEMHFFEIDKEVSLLEYRLIGRQGNQTINQITQLKKKQLFVFDNKNILYFLLFFLSITASLFSLSQRERRSTGTANSFIYPIFLFISMSIAYDISKSVFINYLYLKILILSILLPIAYYFIIQHVYLMCFSFISEQDMSHLIEEFNKALPWEDSTIQINRGRKEILNPRTGEMYIFSEHTVRVKNPTKDLARNKEILMDLYCKTEVDMRLFYFSILIAIGFLVWCFAYIMK